jgi:hypothetical protein
VKTFTGFRPMPPAQYIGKGITNASGTQADYEGVICSDGTVVVRWLTAYRSHSIWACWDDFYQVHGHPEYGTEIVFAGETSPDSHAAALLDLPLPANDSGATTVRGYLLELLAEVWRCEEGFSGKRPFGNSSWQHDVYFPMVAAGLIDGEFDANGDREDADTDTGERLILAAIKALR